MDTFLAQLEHDILDMDWLDDFPQTETSDLGLLADHTRKFFETYTRKYETHITRAAEEVQRKNSARVRRRGRGQRRGRGRGRT